MRVSCAVDAQPQRELPFMGRSRNVVTVRGRWLFVLGTLAAVQNGCVKVNTSTTFTEQFVGEESAVKTVEGSLQYHPTAKVVGESLSVTLKADEQCKTLVTPSFRKTAHHVREIDDASKSSLFSRPRYLVLYAAAALASGAILYFGADSIASGNPDSDPSDYRAYGLILGGFGAAITTVVIADQIRLRDSDEDLGNVRHDPKVSEGVCRPRPVANEKVEFGVEGGDWHAESITDSMGTTRIGLQELPESAFASDLRLSIKVARTSVSLTLPDGSAAQLLATLSEDPKSRVTRDRVATALALCDAAVVAARTASREIKAKPDEAVTAWSDAKNKCGSNWGDEPEKELASVVASARDVHLDVSGREFDTALAAVVVKGEVSSDELERATQLLKSLGELTPPDPQFEKRMKQLRDTRRRALDALIALAQSHLAKGDLDAANADVDAAGVISPDDSRRGRLVAQLQRRRDAQQKQVEAKQAIEAVGRYRFTTFTKARITDEPQQRCGYNAHPGGQYGDPAIGSLDIVVSGKSGKLRVTLNGKPGTNIEERTRGDLVVTFNLPNRNGQRGSLVDGDPLTYNVWFGHTEAGQGFAGLVELVTWKTVRCVYGEWTSDGTFKR